jgi:aryl-alcohol dehydrogenase-like predicted oxidoreductase
MDKRQLGEWQLSRIGIGTYLGNADDETDDLYEHAIARAVKKGVTIVDTASVYRGGRSEKVIGRMKLPANIIVASKAGYLVRGGTQPTDEVVAGCHCMTPSYLRAILDQSTRNLGNRVPDIYYVHNPETQLDEVDRAEFLRRLRAAFATLERSPVKMYGVATWGGFRVPPEDPKHLSLVEILEAAKSVVEGEPRFGVIQLPVNVNMREAIDLPTQLMPDGRRVPLLTAARELGIYVMTSATIAQGHVTDKRAAIRFVTDQPAVGTALIGMKRTKHVDENL